MWGGTQSSMTCVKIHFLFQLLTNMCSSQTDKSLQQATLGQMSEH